MIKACPAFEDRLIDYRELPRDERVEIDAHLSGCASCREYLTLLREIDTTLVAHVRDIRLDPQRRSEVRQVVANTVPVSRVTRLPEWLDFVAAAAICVFAYGLAWQAGVFTYVVSAMRGTP